mmetsp:Transcript_57097/g.121335  ORF Transcript_57097/g.121335 Transcript_57097/m.121335 type:complete len:93 (+) Transcript_57097:1323-1601(+)
MALFRSGFNMTIGRPLADRPAFGKAFGGEDDDDDGDDEEDDDDEDVDSDCWNSSAALLPGAEASAAVDESCRQALRLTCCTPSVFSAVRRGP